MISCEGTVGKDDVLHCAVIDVAKEADIAVGSGVASVGDSDAAHGVALPVVGAAEVSVVVFAAVVADWCVAGVAYDVLRLEEGDAVALVTAHVDDVGQTVEVGLGGYLVGVGCQLVEVAERPDVGLIKCDAEVLADGTAEGVAR